MQIPAKLAELKRRKLLLIYVAILLVCAIPLYKLMISPELERFRVARLQSKSQSDLFETKLEKVQNVDELSQNARRLQLEAGEVASLVFSPDEAVLFMQMLPAMVSQTGNTLVSMTPLDPKALLLQDTSRDAGGKNKPSGCVQIPVNISIKGKYKEVMRLFERLDANEQLLSLSELTIISATDDVSEVNVKFILNLVQTNTELKTLVKQKLPYASPKDQIPTQVVMTTEQKQTEPVPLLTQKVVQAKPPMEAKTDQATVQETSKQETPTAQTIKQVEVISKPKTEQKIVKIQVPVKKQELPSTQPIKKIIPLKTEMRVVQEQQKTEPQSDIRQPVEITQVTQEITPPKPIQLKTKMRIQKQEEPIQKSEEVQLAKKTEVTIKPPIEQKPIHLKTEMVKAQDKPETIEQEIDKPQLEKEPDHVATPQQQIVKQAEVEEYKGRGMRIGAFIDSVKDTNWAEVLRDLGSAMPENVWFTDFKLRNDGDIFFDGFTPSYELVFKLKESLLALPYFDSIKWLSVKSTKVKDIKVFQFEILCGVRKDSGLKGEVEAGATS